MAKTYTVEHAAWSKTKEGRSVYLTAQNQGRIPHLLTKSRIAELVKGGVLKEHGFEEPEEAEEARSAKGESTTSRKKG